MKLRDVLFWGGALIGAACSSTESGNPESHQLGTASPAPAPASVPVPAGSVLMPSASVPEPMPTVGPAPSVMPTAPVPTPSATGTASPVDAGVPPDGLMAPGETLPLPPEAGVMDAGQLVPGSAPGSGAGVPEAGVGRDGG